MEIDVTMLSGIWNVSMPAVVVDAFDLVFGGVIVFLLHRVSSPRVS